jgi:3-oxoadipate enol-lactonase
VKVLLLHAFPLDERMWSPQRPALEGYDVIAPNLYDLGGSSVEDWAERILAGFDDELIAVGASMGGYVGLAMARAAPERVAGLVLAGSRAEPDAPERKEVRDRMIALLRDEGVDAYREAAPFELPPGLTGDELIGALQVLRDRPDATPTVEGFGGPLLVVAGSDDELLSEDEARAVAALAPRGRAEIVTGAGHLVSRDKAERFNALLRDFLSPWT